MHRSGSPTGTASTAVRRSGPKRAPLWWADSSRFEEVCAEVDRDPAEIDRLVLTGSRLDPGLGSASQFGEVAAAYSAVGATDLVVHYPRPTDPYAGDDSVLDFVAEYATTS